VAVVTGQMDGQLNVYSDWETAKKLHGCTDWANG